MLGQHSELLKRAQEEARQAIQRLYLHKQGESEDDEAPHEASFYPLDSAPSTPTNSEMSQSTVYQDIYTSNLQTSHHTDNQPSMQTHRHSNGIDQRLYATPHTRVANGVGMSQGKSTTTPPRSSRNHERNNGFGGGGGGGEMDSGWMGVDQSDAGVFLEMMTDDRQDTKIEQDIGEWMIVLDLFSVN